MQVEQQPASVHEVSPSAEQIPVAVQDAVSTSTTPANATGKKPTRQWAAWTRQEEENFFLALRQVGKNFEKITSRVQSKNKDQVRHYYYRLIKRMNKLLAPAFVVDAKNTKDANAAMLRWWSLLEKHSCSASKLHLKPRRFKTFITALGHQLLKDRKKKKRNDTCQGALEPFISGSSTTGCSKTVVINSDVDNTLPSDALALQKVASGKPTKGKRNAGAGSSRGKRDTSTAKTPRPRRQKATETATNSAAYRKWEKEASAGVTLVAEAAEQLERAAVADHSPLNLECIGKLSHVQSPIVPSGAYLPKQKCMHCQCIVMNSDGESTKIARCENTETDATVLSTSIKQRFTAFKKSGDMTKNSSVQHVEGDPLSQCPQNVGSLKNGEVGKNLALGKYDGGTEKLKLQLFPMDEFTRKALEKDGHNPHLELTLKARKMISSVLQHLIQKWGLSAVASGDLILFPYNAQWKDFPNCQGWTMNDTTSTAGDVHEALGSPPVFRLRYGWVSPHCLRISTTRPCQLPLPEVNEPQKCLHCLQEQNITICGVDDVQSKTVAGTASVTKKRKNTNQNKRVKTEKSLGGSIDTHHKIEKNKCKESEKNFRNSVDTPLNDYQGNDQAVNLSLNPIPSNTQLAENASTERAYQSTSSCVDVKGISSPATTYSEVVGPTSTKMNTDSPISLNGAENVTSPESSKLKETEFVNGIPGNFHGISGFSSQLAGSSWINGQGTHRLPQRLWQDENLKSNTGCLMSTMEWVESLTNISLGELLGEGSQAEKLDIDNGFSFSGRSRNEDFAQCLDSFDAAIAALNGQGGCSENIVNMPVAHAHSSIWDGEETRDSFSFQKLSCSVQETFVKDVKVLPEKEAIIKEGSCSEGLKAVSNHSQENLDCDAGKHGQAADLFWADSLGSLDLGIQPSTATGPELVTGDNSLSLSSLLASSLDAFHNLSFFETERRTSANLESQYYSESPFLANYNGSKSISTLDGSLELEEGTFMFHGSENDGMNSGNETLLGDQKAVQKQSQLAGGNDTINRRSTCMRSDPESHLLPMVGASV